MNIRNCILLTLVLLMPALLIAASMGSGTVSGRVIDAASGERLQGANVVLEGTALGAASNSSGVFHISSVPPGEYTLHASYIGYESDEQTITVEPGKMVEQNLNLNPGSVMVDNIVVYAQRTGQAKALNVQRTSDNIKNVVAADQIGRFPDPNSAEAVQRVPGISVQRDQGEGRFVQIRGTEPRLNSMAINGEILPAPEGDVRFVAMDVIPADQIASIEVNKAITPDMDAEAIGGSVNLVTKSAYDYNKPVFRVTLAPGYNQLTEDTNYQGAITYGRMLTDKLGIMVSGSYFRTNRGSDNNEFEWDDDTVEELELRDYVVTRDRLGVSATLDYHLNPNSKFYVRGIFNKYGDDENRRRMTLVFEDGEVEREFKDRYEIQDIYSINAGGDHTIGNIGIDYNVAYSYAQEEEPDRYDSNFKLEDLTLNQNTSDKNFPAFSVNDGDIYDPASFEFDELVYEDNMTTDQKTTAQLNFSYDYQLGNAPSRLKLGVKLNMGKKDRDNSAEVYEWEGDEDFNMDQVLGDFEDDRFLMDKYRIGLFQDQDKVVDFFKANRSSFERDTDETFEEEMSDYDSEERIYAGYIQSKSQFGDLQVLLGVRYEQTTLNNNGNLIEFDEEGDYQSTTKVEQERNYGHVFPMAHLRYRVNPQTNVRLALTRTIARPNHYDLVPFIFANREDEELERGNPDLEPTLSMNADFMVEHYLRSLGILSAGLFYKNIDDPIYWRLTEAVGGAFDGYESLTPINGGAATLMGVELAWQQQLTFLPGFLNGFGIYLNYTYTSSKAELEGYDDKIQLPGQAQNMANVALSYEKYGFSGRIAMNYHGNFIDEVGEEGDDSHAYYDDHLQIDLSASYRVLPNLSIFGEVINLTNEPLRYTYGDTDIPKQQEYYKWWSHFGIKYHM